MVPFDGPFFTSSLLRHALKRHIHARTLGRHSLRLLSRPGGDAALAWRASDGPPCAPYQPGTHSSHHSSGTPSRGISTRGRFEPWPRDDAALSWHASDGPPCAPYQAARSPFPSGIGAWRRRGGGGPHVGVCALCHHSVDPRQRHPLRAHDLSWRTRRYVYFHVCSSRSLRTLGPELVQIRPAPRVLLRSFGESCSGSLLGARLR